MLPSSSQDRIRRSSHRNPCRICGGEGCGQAGELTLCWRVESEKQARSGAWIHGTKREGFERRIERIEAPRADISRRHQVYSALLERLELRAEHADHLTDVRRLGESTIIAQGFASVPDFNLGRPIVQALAKDFDLQHVPGFWQKDGEWKMRFQNIPGFYVPIRDLQGRIEALQIRRDAMPEGEKRSRYLLLSSDPSEFPQGASSGAPIHYARPDRQATTIITEGALKANICAELLGCCVIGLVAAGTYPFTIGWDLRRAMPEIQKIAIAYDADYRTNDKVRRHLTRLQESLSAAGYDARRLEWPIEQGKGLDDYLINGGMAV